MHQALRRGLAVSLVLLACKGGDSKQGPERETKPAAESPGAPAPAGAEPAAPAAGSAGRTFPCDTVVPAATREKYFTGYKFTEGKGAGLAAKCILNKDPDFSKPVGPERRGGMAMIEVLCERTYSDSDIAEQLATRKQVLDDYQDVSPPVGRAAWTRKAGNQVVFFDAETGCKVDVTWEDGMPTLEVAREVEAALK